MMWWPSGGWGIGGFLVMIIFWGAIIALIVWGITRLARSNNNPSGPAQQTPLEIAKARYARGEITKEQFEQLKKDLS